MPAGGRRERLAAAGTQGSSGKMPLFTGCPIAPSPGG